jgi:hypothetical protein
MSTSTATARTAADRTDPADRVDEERQGVVEQAPVQQRVERPGEGGLEAHVDDLQDGQQAEDRPGERRHHPPRPRRQEEDERDAEESLHRYPRQRTGREVAGLVRHDEGDIHEQGGQSGDHSRGDGVLPAAVPATYLTVGTGQTSHTH